MSRKKGAVGRPKKINKAVIETYCNAVSIGCTYEMAAAYAQISHDSASLWRNRGEAEQKRIADGEESNPEESLYYEFYVAVRQAQLEAGVTWQQVVNDAASKDPNWAWRMLQVRFPDDYRVASPVEVTGKGGKDIVLRVIYGDGTGSPT